VQQASPHGHMALPRSPPATGGRNLRHLLQPTL